jgi:phosphoenolpyruvate-protein phosphotransferase (PTS system enzyme I)
MTALVLSGVAASRGIALGTARLLEGNDFQVPEFQIPSDDVPAEIERYRRAVLAAKEGVLAMSDKLQGPMASEVKEFLDAHLLMMEDAALSEAPLEFIRSRAINAEWALKLARELVVEAFAAMQDEYFRARADDVNQVVARIMAELTNKQARVDVSDSLADVVIVADELEPAELTQMAERGVVGFLSETGGALTHASILARGLGLPYIAGISGARQMINDGAMLIVDGDRGIVLIQPDAERLARYSEKQADARRRQHTLARLRGQRAETRDGVLIRLWANGELDSELKLARDNGAVGVGLYRTEFLFLKAGRAPSEEEQFEDYARAVKAMDGLPLTFRTLDIGADKKLPLGQNPDEANPALGLRGIRLSLSFLALYRTQLRAILRAAAFGPVRLLLPMLGQVQDILRTRELIAECQYELESQGLRCGKNLPLGGMIEVPAAAIAAPLFARELDFMSIGTNDLTQYTLAVDRGNEKLADWYNPLHPAVLRLLAMVIDAGNAAGKTVALCGEMAGEVRYTKLLLALGLRDFSMNPRVLLEVQDAISRIDLAHLSKLRDAVLSGEHEDVLSLVSQ